MTASLADAATTLVGTNPFKGLVWYEENEPLFARDADVDLIQSRLWAGKLTVLFAGSGVGKTSFLKAKLIPVLRRTFGEKNVDFPDDWARTAPDQAIADAINKLSTPDRRSPKGSILILDQFEEVFQHFPDLKLLKQLGSVLASVADDDSDANVRILISIREEFLAELTIFDNFVPGLLTNYYRLNNLTPDQAKLIIEKTAKLAGVNVSAKVDLLISDLQTVKVGPYGELFRFVAPPYLQIVCRGIWTRELPNKMTEFLHSYAVGQAKQELDSYCRDKLNKLTRRGKILVRKALGHLTGPHEAKKYVRLPDLEHELGLKRGGSLGHALRILSDEKSVRILRCRKEIRSTGQETRKSEPIEVFELYHDMYAPMLWKWREEQERREKKLWIARMSITAVAIFFLIVWPAYDFITIKHLFNPSNADEQSDVLDLRNALSQTVLLRPFGDSLWERYNQRLSTLAALNSDTNASLAYRLAGLAVRGNPAAQDGFNTVLGAARYLVGTCKVGNATDAVAVPSDGSGDILVGTAGEIVKCSRDGQIIRTSLDVGPGSKSLTPLAVIRIMGFSPVAPNSPETPELAVAWVTNTENGYVIKVGIFDTESGARKSEAVLPLSEKIQPPQCATQLPVPTAIPATSYLPGGSVNIAEIQKGLRLACIVNDMKAVFSPAPGGPIAIIAADELFLYDRGNSAAKKAPLDSPVAQFEFADDGSFAVLLQSTRFGGQRIVFAKSDGTPVESKNLPLATLPAGSRLVFNSQNELLAQIKGKWSWVSSQGFRLIEGLEPPGSPQAFNSTGDVLLCKDGFGNLIISNLQPGFAFTKIALAGSIGPTLSGNPRKLTSASLVGFKKFKRFLSLDENGAVVRAWDVSTASQELSKVENLLKDTNVSLDPEIPNDPFKRQYYSGDKKWVAKVQIEPPGNHGQLQVHGSESWTAPLDKIPDAITMSSTGDRALLWFRDEILYLKKDRKKGEPINKLPRADFTAGVFGPGKSLVTLLSKSRLAIYSLNSWSGEGPPKPRWAANVQGVSLFDRTGDESGVIAYSGDWIHRITESEWPTVVNIESVMLDLPVTQHFELRPIPSLNSKQYQLVAKDLQHNNEILVIDTNQRVYRTINFETEAKKLSKRGTLQWFSGWRLNLCPDRHENAHPVSTHQTGTWSGFMCEWEHRTGRESESE